MEKNIFLDIEYLGTRYFGFQVQNRKANSEITVQQVIEIALKKLFKTDLKLIYASRTDRGVHARAQAANFKIETNIPCVNIGRALNSFLPYDVRIKKVKNVPLNFHARFSVKTKIYQYIILHRNQPSVFWNNLAWHVDRNLDIAKMKQASKKIIGERDFSLFTKDAKKYKDCIRRIKDIAIKKRGSFIYINIEANGFLRSMARNIVSFLVRIGTEQIKLKDVGAIFKRDIHYLSLPAPAEGLYLYKIKY